MSEFSEKLSQEIRRTNKPLRYLAEASGLQLDYISKMSRGKRIPQEEEKLKCLLDAMECVQRTKETLLRLYRQEKMGRARWGCMQELIRIIEQDDGANAGQEQPAEENSEAENTQQEQPAEECTEVRNTEE